MRGSRNVRCAVRTALRLLLALSAPAAAAAQQGDTLVFRGLELETAGKLREASVAFRQALRGSETISALLGLERTYMEMGWGDSLLTPLAELVTTQPREPIFRAVQLRTLQSLGRDDELGAAFERWVQLQPKDATPYREYARLLLQRGQASLADSVLRRARSSLGGTGALELEVAQLRASQGQWTASARAWRRALREQPYLGQAATFALAPTPADVRDDVRTTFMALPLEPAARLALAGLEAAWGQPAEGWRALKDLPADSASAAAWEEFGTRMEAEERWPLARAALAAALGWRHTPELALRTATAALNAGDAAAALRMAPLPTGADSSAARDGLVALHVQALARLGRPAEAEQLVARMDRWLAPGARASLARMVAFGWVRVGDMRRAQRALESAGADGDSSDASGWLALYRGDIRSARVLLRGGTESSPELATALAVAARIRGDSAAQVGHAFLLLARRDTATAAEAFTEAAAGVPEAASLLLATAAQLHHARGAVRAAELLWQRVIEEHADSPEAPVAALDWARVLRSRGDTTAAAARLEHLILTHPQSALVPQARRELETMRGALPGSR